MTTAFTQRDIYTTLCEAPQTRGRRVNRPRIARISPRVGVSWRNVAWTTVRAELTTASGRGFSQPTGLPDARMP